MDLERISAVGGLLFTNLVLLHWMTNRLTRDMRVNQIENITAIQLLVLQMAGLRTDLTTLLIDKEHKDATTIMGRMDEIKETIERVQQELSVRP